MKLIIAIVIPAALFIWITICSCVCCLCCRPTNEQNMDHQNEKIDPLAHIDKSKIRHWMYIVNNIPGSVS